MNRKIEGFDYIIVVSQAKKILLFGSNNCAGLAICRSLGRAENHISILRLSKQKTTVDYSIFCKDSLFIGSPCSGVAEYLLKLKNLLRLQNFDHLIPIDNLSCELIYFDYEAISLLTHVIGPSPKAHKAIHNQFVAMVIAEAAGLARPATILVKRGETPPEPPFPCIVKPVFLSTIVEDEPQSFSVRKVNSFDDLDSKLRDDLPRADVMLQAPVDGARVDLNFCAIDGNVLGATVTLHLHEIDRNEGSSYKKAEAVCSSTVMMIEKIARELGYTGYMTIECRRMDDRLVFLKMKCWPTESLLLSSFAGVDIANLLIYSLEGKNSNKIALPTRTVYTRHLARDAIWLLTQLRRKNGIKVFIDWAMSFTGVLTGHERFEIEHLNDPLPALHQFDNPIRSIVNKLRLRIASIFVDTQVPEQTLSSLTKKSSILIVCKGNINRSLVAEQLFKAKGFTCVQSAGLLPMTGRRPSRPAEDFLSKRLKVDPSRLRSQSVSRALKRMDHIGVVLCFERRQIAEILLRHPKLRGKVFLLSKVAGDGEEPVDISDPHGKNLETYLACFKRIEKLVDKITDYTN